MQYFKCHMQFKQWKTNVLVSIGWWEFYTCGWCGVICTLWSFCGCEISSSVCTWKYTFEHFWDLSHPQYPGCFHSLILKTTAAVYSCLRQLYLIYLFGHCGQWDSIQMKSEHAHALQYLWNTAHTVFLPFDGVCVFHIVPSLQQNIHIKTLADDMVRCSV